MNGQRGWRAKIVVKDGGAASEHGTTWHSSPLVGGHRVLPATTSLALIVNTADCPTRPPAFAHAPHSRPAQFTGTCSPSYVQVTLTPPAAARILGCPLGELGDQLVDLEDLFGRAARRLVERVREEPDPTRRVTMLDGLLRQRLADGDGLAPEVTHAWRRLTATSGAVAISTLAREIGWTHQHLISRFRREVGTTPKAAARLVRLDGLWRALDRRDDGRGADADYPWAELAVGAGYYDQSHLIRDFRRFTGTTPVDYLARRRPGPHGGTLATPPSRRRLTGSG